MKTNNEHKKMIAVFCCTICVLWNAVAIAVVTETGDIVTFNYGSELHIGNVDEGLIYVDRGDSYGHYRRAYLGYGSDAVGTVTITDTNSIWTGGSYYLGGSLCIGYEGEGYFSVLDGGILSGAGNGYGITLASQPGSFGKLIVSGAGSQTRWLSVGCIGEYGNGILNISDGGIVGSGTCYVGFQPGSTGEVTVDGIGSAWTSGDLHVGSYGKGTLDITNAAAVNCSGALYIGNDGNGTLNITNGGTVSNTNNSFNGRTYIGNKVDSTGVVTIDGIGSTWTNSSDFFYVGSEGNGTLNITNAGVVDSNGACTIGGGPASMGEVTVDGAGSIWTNSNDICLGNGTLEITNAGAIDSNGTCMIGCNPASMGEVTVDGAGSAWTNVGALIVGLVGSGTLNITNGGAVSSGEGYISHQSDSTSEVTVDGAGSAWTNVDTLTVGMYGNGTLKITNGGAVSSGEGYISHQFDSTSEVTVDGAGSTWINDDYLHVGYRGNGTLNITDSGLVSIAGTYLYVGYLGNGTLNITDSGLVSVAGTLGINPYGDGGFVNMATGGMLALNDSDWVSGDGLSDFLALIDGTDAINYWDGAVWADITGATYGDDYTLEHITDGDDLDGYTVLTVNAPGPPEAYDIDEDGDVDFQDYAILASEWLEINCVDPDWCNRADVDHSGDVGILDLQILAEHWLDGTAISDHVFEIEMSLSYDYGEGYSSSIPLNYQFDAWMRVDDTVVSGTLETPEGIVCQAVMEVDEGENWLGVYEESASLGDLSDFTDGIYIFTVTYANGQSQSTLIPFEAQNGSPLTVPPQPEMDDPVHNSTNVPLSTSFIIDPSNMTNPIWTYGIEYFPASGSGLEGKFESLSNTTTTVGPVDLSPSTVYNIELTANHAVWSTNSDGIAYVVDKDSEVEIIFTTVSAP